MTQVQLRTIIIFNWLTKTNACIVHNAQATCSRDFRAYPGPLVIGTSSFWTSSRVAYTRSKHILFLLIILLLRLTKKFFLKTFKSSHFQQFISRLPDNCLPSQLMLFLTEQARMLDSDLAPAGVDVYWCTPFPQFGFVTFGGQLIAKKLYQFVFSPLFCYKKQNKFVEMRTSKIKND